MKVLAVKTDKFQFKCFLSVLHKELVVGKSTNKKIRTHINSSIMVENVVSLLMLNLVVIILDDFVMASMFIHSIKIGLASVVSVIEVVIGMLLTCLL